MLVLYAPAREGGSARAAGQSAGLPPAPTRLFGEVGDHGTAVPAVTEGAIPEPGTGFAPWPVWTVDAGPDEERDAVPAGAGTVVTTAVVVPRAEVGPWEPTLVVLLRRAAWLGRAARPETATVTAAPASTTTAAPTATTSALRLLRRGPSQ